MHLYNQVADQIKTLIEQGTLRPGERVPSVRKLSTQQGLSMSTVLQAYALLENRGFIEARPQSGYYVRLRSLNLPAQPAKSNPPPSPTEVGISDLVSEIIKAAQDPKIVSLGITSPWVDLFPIQQLNRTMASLGRRYPDATFSYGWPPGYEALRREIARRSLEWGGQLSKDDIVTTCGCIEALNLCLKAVAKPGDTIAIESPTYFGILQVIESLGMKVLEIPTCPSDGICIEAMGRALSKKKIKAAIVMTNFNNPLGSCMPEENKKALVEMLASQDIPLIEDDVDGDLYFSEERPKPAKYYDRKGLVLLCSSFSKTLAPGLRIGWVAPGKFREQIERLKFMSTGGTPVLPQMTIAHFLEYGGYDRHLRRLRKALATQVQLATHAISKYFPAGTKVTRPNGGHLLWVELPQKVDSLKLYQKAIEANISIAPGMIFSAKQKYPNFIRLNFGNAWSDSIEVALVKLGQLVSKS
ncbi:MAG: PLP-dependent aminotransferase family protein [Acidobacteriota bacterium]